MMSDAAPDGRDLNDDSKFMACGPVIIGCSLILVVIIISIILALLAVINR